MRFLIAVAITVALWVGAVCIAIHDAQTKRMQEIQQHSRSNQQ